MNGGAGGSEGLPPLPTGQVASGNQPPPLGFSADDPERQPAGLLITDARAAALAEFHEVVRSEIRAGRAVPCVADPEGGWTSDDKHERERAAWRCLDCPAFLACEQYRLAFPESGGVWAGVGFSPGRAVDYLQRPEPDPESSMPSIAHVLMESEAKQPLTREIDQLKEAIMTTNQPTGTCLCGCGEPAGRNYRPGHDARHVSTLVRAVAEGTTDKRAALKALPTEALRAKFTRATDRAKKGVAA